MNSVMFGLNVSPSTAQNSDPVLYARRAEELGFQFVSMNDHLHGEEPRHETWTMLTWIAAATSTIRVATRVLAVPYRHPAVTAKMAETLDRLSGGRLILGLGGGYSDEEFHAFGLGERSPRDKVDGLDEAIRIVRGLWSHPTFTFDGRLYRTDAARVEPKPERRIPIWVRTYGPRALALTGRLADGWIPTLELASPERIPGMRGRVLSAGREVGREPEEITCVYNIDVRVDERADEPPSVVAGPARARGPTTTQLPGPWLHGHEPVPVGPDQDEQAERLAREVVPAVRSSATGVR